MFYSTDILALKNKTSLAYLFYLSTTDNKSKRLSKKEIDNISITNALVILKNPPQPFALRLYAILMKGLVKVYAVKMKHMESEIVAFHRVFVYKPPVRKNQKNKKLEIKMVFDDVNIGDLTDFIDNVNNSIANTMTSVENVMRNDTISFANDDCLYDNVCLPDTENNDINSRTIDDIITLPEEKIKLRKIVNVCNKKSYKNDLLWDFPIARIVTSFFEVDHKILREDSAVEGVRKESSLLFLPQTSTSFVKQEAYGDYDFFDGNQADDCKAVDIEEELNINYNINFNETVRNASKYDKGLQFLKVLELLNNNIITVEQEKPYDIIYIKNK